jgi:glycosyltransferase involved in cell wall biosynthesis
VAAPVFAFLAFTSGSYEGAIIRDMRLANALHRRGFRVHIYWMMEQNRILLDAGIPQRYLCCGMRYQFQRPSGLMERVGRMVQPLMPAARRRRFVLQHPDYLKRLMSNCCRAICDGDPGLERRLAHYARTDGITHLLPTFAMICPFAQAAKAQANFNYLVTFQGEEIFANFAQDIGRLDDYHRRLRQTLDASPWPAIAVSRDYIDRLSQEMGIDAQRLRAIYPGIELPPKPDDARAEDHPAPLANEKERSSGGGAGPSSARNSAPPTADFDLLHSLFKGLVPDVPIVSFLGRQDAEKGIDLLLYATKLLEQRGLRIQLLCVGDSSFGQHYNDACEQIAQHLRLTVFWKRRVSDAVRTAIYRASRCVVYPSIHREPFGMVAAEAMSYGTPVLVPDRGGITEVISQDGRIGGLVFQAWDTRDLADQLEKLLRDQTLYQRLRADAPVVAAQFSVERMTDRVLEHMGLPLAADA